MKIEDASQQPFPETRWSLMRRARGGTKESRRALEEICQSYWQPLYAFARRRGKSPEEAEDLTQEFFIHLLEKETFETIESEGGKLRSFLLGAFQNFSVDRHRYAQALKRGGGTLAFSLDTAPVEIELQEAASLGKPDELFERQWALGLLDHAMQQLRGDYAGNGKEDVFEVLHPILQGGAGEGYRELGARLEMREGAVKVAVHRMRQRFRHFLNLAVLETVGSESEVEEELDFIREVLRR